MKILINIILYIFTISLFSTCDSKTCKDVVCGQNQTCNSGVCYCTNGYEGNSCLDFAAEKYRGDYNISKSCEQGTGGFATFGTIAADGSPINELLFYNFLGLGHTAYAFIYTDETGKGNYLRFPEQNIGSAKIVGEGYYEDYSSIGRLRLEIQLTMNNQLSKCTYTYY